MLLTYSRCRTHPALLDQATRWRPHLSEIRAELLSHLGQLSATDAEIQLDFVVDQFSQRHNFQRELVSAALSDLRAFGLVRTTPNTVALTDLAKRLLR
jgi:GNAT superfamily N-acetyltransferase